MDIETIQIEVLKNKADVKTAWRETIKEMGFTRHQFEDRHRKKIVTWEKDGTEFTARVTAHGDQIKFTFTKYQ